jgi:hypothetical protein
MPGTFRDLEKGLWGKASEPTIGGLGAKPTEWSGFSRSLIWLRNALGLFAGNVPNTIDETNVLPALDVFQGGYPFSVYVPTAGTITGIVGAFDFVVIDISQQVTQRLYAFEVVHSGAGALGTVPFQMTVITNTGQAIRIAQGTLAAGAVLPSIATLQDVFGARDIWLPPGFQLRLQGGVLGVNDTISFTANTQQIPAGFKP